MAVRLCVAIVHKKGMLRRILFNDDIVPESTNCALVRKYLEPDKISRPRPQDTTAVAVAATIHIGPRPPQSQATWANHRPIMRAHLIITGPRHLLPSRCHRPVRQCLHHFFVPQRMIRTVAHRR